MNIGATSQDTQDKTHHKIISLLDFQKKMLGSAGPQVFIFGWQDKSSSRQKEIFKN